MTRSRIISIACLLVAAARVACGTADGAETSGTAPQARSGEWQTIGRTHDEQHYSPLRDINTGNVRRLGLAWYVDLNTTRGVEAEPLFVEGTLYNISAWNIASAIDARTGKVLWTYDPKVPPQFARWACCDVVSRGLAVWKGEVILATLDGRLIALDRKSGKPVWTRQTIDRDGHYSITGAPRVFGDKVLIGNGGADFQARGYVTAYAAATGEPVWRFYLVPGDPQHPDGAASDAALRDIAAPTWDSGYWTKTGGGGGAWDAMAYDPGTGLVYIGTGNGSPGPQALRSPHGGDNLFIASIVAVRLDTGAYAWHLQENPGEQWDYDSTQSIVLADLTLEGRPRKALIQAAKNGFFYVIDRVNGRLISAQPFAAMTWAKMIEPQTGRPVETPEARYDNEPRLVAPGPGGAHNWQPMSYSPLTGLAYIPVQDQWGVFPLASVRPEGDVPAELKASRQQRSLELGKLAEQREQAWLSAWDPVSQRERWRVKRSRPGAGGLLSTGGNLVIQGTPDRTLAIYQADTGAELLELPTVNAPIASPITYKVGNEQYIAINAGWGGGMALVEMAQGKPPLPNGPARLLAFKLDGHAKLPPFLPQPLTRPQPPLARAPETQVRAGGELFEATCARCHGTNVRGGLKDLRWMTRDTLAKFQDIVRGGLYLQKGMPNFKDEYDAQQVEAIKAYIIARANEDYFADSPNP